MPNWCMNKLTIMGPAEELTKFQAFCESLDTSSAGREFAFEWFVPIPLTNPAEPEPKPKQKPEIGLDQINTVDEMRQWLTHLQSSSPVAQELDEEGREKGWYNTWGYDWCITNWGTKWNAETPLRVDGGDFVGVTFETAWSPSLPVTAAIAQRFPCLTIEHSYGEGGMGFAGNAVYVNGVEESHDEFDFRESEWASDDDYDDEEAESEAETEVETEAETEAETEDDD